MKFDNLYDHYNVNINNLRKYLRLSDDEEKIVLIRDHPHLFDIFIKEREIETNLQSSDLINNISENIFNNDCIKRFGDWLYEIVFKKNKRISYGIKDEDLPSWMFLRYEEDVDDEILIHFTNRAKEIQENGFQKGISDMTRLGLTTFILDSQKENIGYVFAYSLKDFKKYTREFNHEKYGKSFVLFIASGIKCWHYSDEELQVITYGSDARNIVAGIEDKEKYTVYSKEGKPLFEDNRIGKVISYIIHNPDVIMEKILI